MAKRKAAAKNDKRFSGWRDAPKMCPHSGMAIASGPLALIVEQAKTIPKSAFPRIMCKILVRLQASLGLFASRGSCIRVVEL
jgi:hypothetical protein